jgi:hypothetical protein
VTVHRPVGRATSPLAAREQTLRASQAGGPQSALATHARRAISQLARLAVRLGDGQVGGRLVKASPGEVTPCAPQGQPGKGWAWPRCGRRCTSKTTSRCGWPEGLPRRAVTGTRSSTIQGDGKGWPTSTFAAVSGRFVLRCSGRANHRDPVMPPHLPEGKTGSGRPPGRKFQQRIDLGERAWSAATPTQPKGDPP